MCPFCYIGKRNFESALTQFEHKDQLEVVWKSFQLDPNMPDVPEGNQEDYLVKHKGLSREQIKGMMTNVTDYAKRVGLDFHLDRSIMVNSFKAHQFIQFAKEKGLGDQAEEVLFSAYFTEGKNVADVQTLKDLAKVIGLNPEEVDTAFTDDQYSYQVKQDIQEAQSLGVTGVPFFVFDRKYAISGAQPPDQFLQTLSRSFPEWQESNTAAKLIVNEGDSCAVDGSGAC